MIGDTSEGDDEAPDSEGKFQTPLSWKVFSSG